MNDWSKFDPAAIVKIVVATRDKLAELKREHQAKCAPHQARLDMCEGILLEFLDDHKSKNMSTEEGTFYRKTNYRASLEDPEAFMAYVRTTGKLELLERRASTTAVQDFVKENKEPPPGAKLTAETVVNVNRVTGRDYKLAG